VRPSAFAVSQEVSLPDPFVFGPAPETFTHGTPKQRVRWFTRGIESGDLRECDTFRRRV
jgi:hypothetical protein